MISSPMPSLSCATWVPRVFCHGMRGKEIDYPARIASRLTTGSSRTTSASCVGDGPMRLQRLPADIPRNGVLCRFERDERHGMILFIRETDVSHRNASFPHELARPSVERQHGLTLRVMGHFNVVQLHAVAEPGAHGLDRGLLGGETTRKKVCLIDVLMKLQQLACREDSLGKSIAEATEIVPYAPHAHDVRADSKYHLEARRKREKTGHRVHRGHRVKPFFFISVCSVISVAEILTFINPLNPVNPVNPVHSFCQFLYSLDSVPMPSMTISTLLPGFIEPTPTDVPQEMTSPG